MFLHKDHFIEAGFDPDSAELAAKIGNGIIDNDGKVVTGELLQNGEIHSFGSEQGVNDTHVGILIGLSLMGKLKPHASPVALERPTKQDLERMLGDRVKQLEQENRMLRGNK